MKIKKSFLICFIVTLVLLIVSIVLVSVAAVKSHREMDLGTDVSSYNITKMYTDNETIRVIGTQEGEVFAIDTDGELLWDVGTPYVSAVYELTMYDDTVFVVYANGIVLSFMQETAVV